MKENELSPNKEIDNLNYVKEQVKRPTFGHWKKEKSKGLRSEMSVFCPEAYSDNG